MIARGMQCHNKIHALAMHCSRTLRMEYVSMTHIQINM